MFFLKLLTTINTYFHQLIINLWRHFFVFLKFFFELLKIIRFLLTKICLFHHFFLKFLTKIFFKSILRWYFGVQALVRYNLFFKSKKYLLWLSNTLYYITFEQKLTQLWEILEMHKFCKIGAFPPKTGGHPLIANLLRIFYRKCLINFL